MRKLLFACILSVPAAPAFCDQGCVEFSTTTVTTTSCTQFDCVQQADGNCQTWSCNKTQTSKYIDANTSGCTRAANCGKRALFKAGEPDEPDLDSSEMCDWYPCVQSDPATQSCLSYMCVSKRVFQTVHTTYSNAQCIPVAPKPGLLTLPSGEKLEQLNPTEIRPSPVKKAPTIIPRLK